MKNALKLIFFIVYTMTIFFISKYYMIILVTFINILLMFLLEIDIKSAIKTLLRITPFIFFIVIINILVDSVQRGIFIGIRLILVCNITFTFSKIYNPQMLANAIENILTPLKIFKINTKDIGIMICLAITFIPILKDEVNKIKESLISKGINTSGWNMIKNIKLILVPLIISIIKRVEQIENSLKAKAYVVE